MKSPPVNIQVSLVWGTSPHYPPCLQEHRRFLQPTELLAAQTLPTTNLQAEQCGAPKLVCREVKKSSLYRMAGNSISVPCLGTIVLAAICGLERTQY